MTVGFPDYARLSQQGGFLLFSESGTPPEFTNLFTGYVGSWPYINMFTLMGASADFARINLIYCSDATFTTQVGFRYATRTGNSFAMTQYSNLSPWLQIFYTTVSGNPIPFTQWSIYGTNGFAGQQQLASADVPIFTFNQNIAATGNFTVQPQHIQPGDGSLMIYTTSPKWHGQLEYYDYSAGGLNQLLHIDNNLSAPGGIFDMPMLDAPHTFIISNDDSVTHQFVCTWTSK